MKRNIVSGIFICMALSAAFSQELVTFTVEKAVEYAMKNSRTLKSADIDLEIKKRAADYSWNVLVPNVQVSGTLSRQNDISSTIDSANASVQMANAFSALTGAPKQKKIEETESMHWAAVGNLGVSWNFSLAYIEQIKAAKLDYETGLITKKQSMKETEVNVKKLFYGLLLQQENIKLQKVTLENARRRSNQAYTNYENGSVPELSYLQAYVAYENQKPSVADAERTFRQQIDTFAFILGLPVGTDIVLDGSIEPEYIDLIADELISQYGSGSLDIQSLESSKKTLEANLKALNLSSFSPAFAFNYGFQPMHTDAFNSDNSWFDGDNWKDSGSMSFTLAWNITNMLPFSDNRQKAQDLKDNIKKLELSKETLKENQKMEVIKALDTMKSAREQIHAMTRNITLAQRSYEMAERSYQAGTTELLSLCDSEEQLFKAKLGLANQKFNYIAAMLDLEKILNTTFGD